MTKMNSKWPLRKVFWAKQKNRQFFIVIVTLVYFFLFLFLSFARHDGLKTQMNDLGNMVQPIHNTLNGSFMKSSNYILSDQSEISRFGIHSNYILLMLVPLYSIFPSPKLLLFIQIAFVTAGALGLYWLGEKVYDNKTKWLSVLVPVLYLTNPFVQDVTLFDFRPLAVAMPLIIFAFYFLHTQKKAPFYLFASLVLLTKEDMALVMAMMGLFLIFSKKRYQEGLFVFIASLIYFYLNVGYLLPFFAKESGLAIIAERYSYLGQNIFEIIAAIITKPGLLIKSLFQISKIFYVIILLLPVIFLPLLAPAIFIMTTPSFLINLLSQNPMTYWPFQYYHSAPILSFIFIASIFGLNRIKKKGLLILKKQTVVKILIVVNLVFSLLLSPAPYSLISSLSEFTVPEHAKKIKEIEKQIPQNASLSVQNNLGAHFAHRKRIFSFPSHAESSEFILLDINNPYSQLRLFPRHFSFIYAVQMSLDNYQKEVEKVFNDPGLGVSYYSDDGYLIFQKNHSQEQNPVAREMFNRNYDQIRSNHQIESVASAK